MERKVVVLCTIGAILGLLSVLLGFAAEATRVKASQVSPPNGANIACVYPNSHSSALGYVSALALLVALIMINVAGRCFCCNRRGEYPPSAPRCQCTWSLVFFIFSWVIFVPAFLQLLGAAVTPITNSLDDSYCHYTKSGAFAVGASLSFVSVALGLAYSLSLGYNNPGKGGAGGAPAPQGGGFAVGQPQLPFSMQQPGSIYAV